MKKLIFSFLLVILVAFTSSAALLEDKTLSVIGTGSVQIAPDTAKVKLGVEVVKKTAQEAQADNAATMQKIINALTKQGISKEKIQTSGFSIWPEIKYEMNQPPKIVGYRCGNQVNVTIEDLNKVSKVIDTGIEAGANQVQGIQFTREEDTEFKKLALEKAVKDASAKAQAIALAAGMKIKSIKSIIEGGAGPSPQAEFGVKAMNVGGVETPVSPGLIEIKKSVTIIYKISE